MHHSMPWLLEFRRSPHGCAVCSDRKMDVIRGRQLRSGRLLRVWMAAATQPIGLVAEERRDSLLAERQAGLQLGLFC